MRIFTAIPLSEEAKKQIADVVRERLPVAYINTTTLHITLNFFGELSDAEVIQIKRIFEQAVRGIKPFEVEMETVQKFHQQIHITLKENSDLRALQMKLETAFRKEGFYFQERNYYPHIKLANMHYDKLMRTERKLENFPNHELTKIKIKVDRVTLFESKLLLHHAHHYPLLEVLLS